MHSDPYILLHNFGVQIIPFYLKKWKKFIEGKDIAKSQHTAHYLQMKIMALRAMTIGTSWVDIV